MEETFMVAKQIDVLDSMSQIKNHLNKYNETVSVAESLTAGHLQSLMSHLPGSSDFFEGGICAYQLRHKVGLLDVDETHGGWVNCVSPRIACRMAQTVSQLFSSQWGVATTGYAQTDIETITPYAYIAVVYHQAIRHCGKHVVSGLDRVDTQQAIARCAIQALRQCMVNDQCLLNSQQH